MVLGCSLTRRHKLPRRVGWHCGASRRLRLGDGSRSGWLASIAVDDPLSKTPARTQGMTQRIEDPRPLPTFDRLPHYARAWERWGTHPEVARNLIYLGVKLTDADYFRSCLAHVDVNRLSIPEQRAFSRDLDAFVF